MERVLVGIMVGCMLDCWNADPREDSSVAGMAAGLGLTILIEILSYENRALIP